MKLLFTFTIQLIFTLTMTAQQPRTILEFNGDHKQIDWYIVNDGVMGGLSDSELKQFEKSIGTFRGHVSLENNGGFASVRAQKKLALSGNTTLQLKVKGDGRTYQFRFRSSGDFDGTAYRYEFETIKGEWKEVDIPIAEMEPVFRGRVLNTGPIDQSEIAQFGFMIADKKQGKFRLDIDWIKVY